VEGAGGIVRVQGQNLPAKVERHGGKREDGEGSARAATAKQPKVRTPAGQRQPIEPGDARLHVPAERQGRGADADQGVVLAVLQRVDLS